MFELGLEYRNLSEGELRLSLLDRLEPSENCASEGILIVVDEAHTLPEKLLEELRLITNFTRNGQPRTRLVLIGNMRLEDTFSKPSMESFNQRLAARCYLAPMTRDETFGYINHQIQVAGCAPKELITDEARQTVYLACEGVPRLTNQIMDHALVIGLTRNECPIQPSIVDEAWADLQQLPLPFVTVADRQDEEVANEVEFGSLQDEPVSTSPPSPHESSFESIDEEVVAVVEFDASSPPSNQIEDNVEEQVETDENNIDNFETDQELDSPIEDANFGTLTPTFATDDTDEQDVELSLPTESLPAVEPLPAEAAPSFFAAFATPAEDELPEEIESKLSEQTQAQSELEPDSTSEENAEDHDVLERPTFTVENENPASTEDLAPDSFFDDKPTDEMLIAFNEEQNAFVEMGIWNPGSAGADMTTVDIRVGSDDEQTSVAPTAHTEEPLEKEEPKLEQSTEEQSTEEQSTEVQDEPHTFDSSKITSIPETAAAPSNTASELFGSDFDDEMTLEEAAADRREQGDLAIPSPDQLIDQVADAEIANSQISENTQPWTIDIAPVEHSQEIQLQEEIEDIISQLNFSSFTEESFSVEHVSIEPGTQPLASSQLETEHPSENEAAPNAPDEEQVYTMEQEESTSNETHTPSTDVPSDDDRDMLIVEEEIKAPAENSKQEVQRVAPYRQLFAKLRN